MKFHGPQALIDTRDSPEIAMVCRAHLVIDWASRSPLLGSLN
jgi:hypothetical protein